VNRFIQILLVTIATLIVSLGGCAREERPLNLVLITVDTLRPDHLGYNGHSRPTSPVVDRLASEGVVFTSAYSAAGWTLPSVATILTGRYPKDHGATDFHWSIDTEIPTLASVLDAHGYATHGYVSHVTLTPSYGIGNDFDHYDYSALDVGHPHDVATAKPLTDLALDGLARAREPYFLWVHYFDPHFQYLSHPAFAKWGQRDIDRYDGEIAHTDYYIGKLLRAVDEKHTVIVFTADHGEEFGEHGGKYHYTMYQEVMRVPLVVKAPGLAPRVERGPVQQVDLMPTLLGLLGVEAPSGLPGRDLFAPPSPRAREEPGPVFIERDRPPPWRQQGVIMGAHKLFVVEEIDSASIPPASRGTEVPVGNVRAGIYLYDLTADPGERKNLFAESDARAMELLGLVAEHFATRRFQETAVELDPELMQKLRSLGYLR